MFLSVLNAHLSLIILAFMSFCALLSLLTTLASCVNWSTSSNGTPWILVCTATALTCIFLFPFADVQTCFLLKVGRRKKERRCHQRNQGLLGGRTESIVFHENV